MGGSAGEPAKEKTRLLPNWTRADARLDRMPQLTALTPQPSWSGSMMNLGIGWLMPSPSLRRSRWMRLLSREILSADRSNTSLRSTGCESSAARFLFVPFCLTLQTVRLLRSARNDEALGWTASPPTFMPMDGRRLMGSFEPDFRKDCGSTRELQRRARCVEYEKEWEEVGERLLATKI